VPAPKASDRHCGGISLPKAPITTGEGGAGKPKADYDAGKLRWRIERDYQELKQEVGLGHFEGRGWRGFHHHATLCIAAYGFLISERETIPPSTDRATRVFPQFALCEGYQPRASAVAA
jgi:hypothetical protein